MKYKGKDIEFVSGAMKFEVLPPLNGQAFPRKYYVSVEAAKKAIDNAEEKRIAMAKADKVAKPVKVFEVDVRYIGLSNDEKYFTRDHTIVKYKADGVGRNRKYFFISNKKNNDYGAWRHGYETRFGFGETSGRTRLFDAKDKAKVQKILDKRNELYNQLNAIQKKIDDLDNAEDKYRLTKSALLGKMGLPTDL